MLSPQDVYCCSDQPCLVLGKPQFNFAKFGQRRFSNYWNLIFGITEGIYREWSGGAECHAHKLSAHINSKKDWMEGGGWWFLTICNNLIMCNNFSVLNWSKPDFPVTHPVTNHPALRIVVVKPPTPTQHNTTVGFDTNMTEQTTPPPPPPTPHTNFSGTSS